MASKITVAGVRQNVKELLEYSTETKKRNCTGFEFKIPRNVY
jgi:hypothetical protein